MTGLVGKKEVVHMSPLGIVTWILVGLALAALAVTWLRWSGHSTTFHAASYTVAGALLGTFMGSEAFKGSWGPIGSEHGVSVGGYYVLTSLLFGICITVLATLAAASPALAEERAQ
jgi:hypothetical protein